MTISRLLCLSLALLFTGLGGFAQDADLDAEAARQKQIAERFQGVLEKNPRRGTALDRVYGYHVEWGTLDKFVETLKERTKKDPKDGTAWMLLGLIQSQRGEDAGAVESFKQAEATSENALASYYLGQSLVLVGQPDQAVEAYERAINKKPAPTDLLEIFQQLGRVHQRAQRTDKALEAWNRLEKLFPNDARVQEQIAVTLVEEGQPALALPRYETLAKITKDDYRKTVYKIEAAELKVKLGKSPEGIADLEAVMAGLNPDSWLHREVRRRIEEVFLRTDDQDGLVKYYEGWIAKHKDDVDSMARLARVLARGARVPEATVWLDKALKLAPKRKELRLAFIEQLADDQRFGDVAKQFAELDKVDPNNPDYIREWGKAILKDRAQTIDVRKKSAEQVWRKLLVARPKDALIATQVADLFRQAEMKDQALELYKKAVTLSPDDPQYREYLGEYYHLLKQPQEALKTWKEIATGKRRTAENVARLAEVYSGFGYTNEAVIEIAAACKLDPKDFSLQLRSADYHTRAEKYVEALAYVTAGEKLAANEDEHEEVLLQRIKVFQAKLSLDEEIEKLAAESKKPNAKAATSYLLARYYEANRQFPEASLAIADALKKDAKSIPALATAARIEEQAGNLQKAADLSRKLADADRRSRTDHLMTVSRLESQLGRKEEALQAGRDVIAAAPGNTENYEFFAQLCFRLGATDEGLDTLRRAVRINPTEPKLGLALAAALAEQLRTDEAIQVYWSAFEKLTELDDKLQVIQKQTDLYTQLNQFDKLVDRLERDRREEEKRREMTICLSQAHHSSGDYGTARQELESLLSENTRDTQLLQQLSKLAEEENDIPASVKYQEQLAKIAPGHESEYRLAQLLQRAGEHEDAAAILVKLTQREQDPERVLRSIDQLLSGGRHETVVAITDPLLREQPRNWELIYREGAAYAMWDKPAEAAERFKRLLDLTTPLDELGIAAANRRKQQLAKLKSANNAGGRRSAAVVPEMTVYTHLDEIYRINYAVGLQNEDYYYGGQGQQPVWTPQMYVAARTAALGWQLAFATKGNKADEFVASLKKTVDVPKPDERALMDWLCLQTLRGDGTEVFNISRKMARQGGLVAKQRYITAVAGRMNNRQQQEIYYSDEGTSTEDRTPPLPDDDLALLLECYQAALKATDENSGSNYYTQTVATELKRAKRNEEAEKLVQESIAKAKGPAQLSAAMAVVAEKGDMAGVQSLFDRWSKEWLAQPQNTRGQQQYYYYESPNQYVRQIMGLKGEEKAHADVLKLYDQYLTHAFADTNLRRANTKRRSNSQQNYYGWGYQYYYGKQQMSTQVDYPSPNEYVDYNTLMVVRNAYEIFKRNDVESDFVAHLKKRAESSTGNDRIYDRLLYGYGLWWTDDREEAMVALRSAAELVPQDINIQLEFASLEEAQGNFDDALAMVDAVTPLDQASVQRRETMALQLAERLGDVDRARTAAERLFGLRLDSNTQLVLAQRMRRLGMDKLAEAVTARAQRQAGNRTSSLLTLMTHYQGLGRIDLAIQLAHTILRRSPTAAASLGSSRGGRRMSSDDGSRSQALQLLAQTGTLDEMIARAEAQAKQTNDPASLYANLAELYTAKGDRDKALELQGKILESRPEDYGLRYQYAQQLQNSNKMDEACQQYLAILKKRPELLADNFYQVNNIFRQANKTAELGAALDQIDLKGFRSPWYVMDVATNILRQKETRDTGLRLFKKVFESYPQYRRYLINRLYDEELWQMPEVYELAKQGLIPAGAQAKIANWQGLNEIYSYSGEGKVTTAVSKVLDAMAKQNKFDDFRKELNAGLARYPDWHAGKVLLALVDFKQGKKDEAKKALLAVVNDEAILKTMNSQSRWIVGQELENFGDMQEVVVKLYEGAFESGDRNQNEFQYTPGMRLVHLYAAAGRKDDARKLLLKAYEQKPQQNYDRDYNQYRMVQGGLSIAEQMQKLEFTVDALRVYRDLISDPNRLAIADRWYGSPNYLSNRVRTKLAELMKSLTPEKAAGVVLELLKTPPGRAAAKPGEMKEPVIDLMVSAPARELEKSQMQSAFTALLRDVTKTSATEAPLREAVTKLATENPDDLSAQIISILLLSQAKKADDVAAQLPKLMALVEKTPLETLAEGKRPNSRQRAEALAQVPLWLVARELLADEKQRELGTQLGERALAAAGRQLDTMYSASILHEWGEIDLQAGNRQQAEERWAKLLELVTERPKPKKKPAAAPAEGPPRPVSGANRRPSPPDEGERVAEVRVRGSGDKAGLRASGLQTESVARAARAERRLPPSSALSGTFSPRWGEKDLAWPTWRLSVLAFTLAAFQEAPPAAKPAAAAPAADRVPPITLSQFNLAVQLAKIAAQNDMPQLSLRAVKQALAGGAPLPDLPQDGASSGAMLSGRTVVSAPSLDAGTSDQTLEAVANALRDLSGVWEAKNIPADDVYALLKPIVFSEERPGEILLYPLGVQPGAAQQNSLGATLVTWAFRAKKVDDLKKAVAERGSTLQGRLPGNVLTVQIALRENDKATAKTALKAIVEHLQTDQNQNNVQLACHAALPAFELPELADDSIPIIERTIVQFAAQGRDDVSDFTRKLVRHYGRKGDILAAKKQLETFLGSRQRRYADYGGDYALYLQRQDMATAALEAARVGMPDLAIEFLGRYSDAPPYRYSDVAIDRQLFLVARELLKKPAAERYELLKTWTLPAEKRKTVRLMAGWIEPNRVPAQFARKTVGPQVGSSSGGASPASLDTECVSNFSLLFDAAQEAGKLPELIEDVRKAVDQKIPRADLLLAVLLVRQGDREAAPPVLEGLLSGFDARNPQQDNRTQKGISIWTEYVVCRTLLESSHFADFGRRYADKVRGLTQRDQKWDFMTWLRYDVARANIRDQQAALQPGDLPDLKYWTPSTPFGHALPMDRPWWVAHDGQVAHIGGPGNDFLYFNWPVTGDFEFSVDAYNGSWAESDVGYAGIVVESQHRGSTASVWPLGQHETIRMGDPMEREGAGFGRVTVRMKGGQLTYLLNGYVVHEEAASPTSPWIQLYGHYERLTSFKNLQISGQPVIPREVKLIDGNRLEGWMTVFGDNQPRRRLLAKKPSENPDDYDNRQRNEEPKVYDWDAKDGELIGTITPGSNDGQQALLTYHRPLQPGDRLRYEFFYEPGKNEIHPATGKIAFLLDPKGVKLHWLTRGGWEEDVWDVGHQTAVDDASIRREPVALKANDWNAVEVALKGDVLSVTLNGTLVAERTLESDNDRRFGFFRYRGRTGSKVRNVVLTGDWPEAIPAEALANLIAPGGEASPADRRARHAVVTELFYLEDTFDVWRHALALPAEERYALLKNWVLPGDDHPTYRLMVASLPIKADVATLLKAGTATGTGTANLPDSALANRAGNLQRGSVVAPVFLLVDTAKEIGKLTDLQTAVNAAPSKTNDEKRGQLAMQVLLSQAAGDMAVADQRLRELYVHVQPLLPETLPLHERMPEYVAAWRACDTPALTAVARDIAQLLVDKHQAKNAGEDWDRLVRELRGRARWTLGAVPGSKPFGSDTDGLTQWTLAPFLTARQRGEGYRPSGWRYVRGSAEHVPGHATSRLMFNTPLRGDFVVSGVRSTYGWRETYVDVAGIGVDPLHNQTGYWMRKFQRDFQKPDKQLSLPGWNHFMEFKMTVKGGVLTAEFNGVPVHTEPVLPNRDPWVIVESSRVGQLGTVRNVQITGTPEIPEVLVLSEIDHLAGWRADRYGDSLGEGEGSHWRWAGEEIVGSKRPDRVGDWRESVLTYQRPVIEDGEIEYEFLYLPGEQETHPAVGDDVFLLTAEGVRHHKLTDAQYELTGLTPDNQSPIAGAGALALKPTEWNTARLTFRGSTVALAVNGAEVAKLEIPVSGERQFGLFRYSDKSGCRVRKVRYRGDWPKSLPQVEDQQLAYAPGGFVAPVAESLVETKIALNQPQDKLTAAGLKRAGDPKFFTTLPDGTKFSLPAAQPKKLGSIGLMRDKALKGDFDVSLKFRDLKIAAPKDGHGTGLDFNVYMTDPNNTRVAIERRTLKDGKPILHAVSAHKKPDGTDHFEVWSKETDFGDGTFRMVRNGGRVYFLFALGDSTEFTLLQTLDVGNYDVRQINAFCQTSDAVSGVETVLKELTIKEKPAEQ